MIVSRDSLLGEPYRIPVKLTEETGVSDLEILKRAFLNQTQTSGSIYHFGGDELTTTEKLTVVYFDDEAQMELTFEPFDEISHLQNVTVKIKKTTLAPGVLFYASLKQIIQITVLFFFTFRHIIIFSCLRLTCAGQYYSPIFRYYTD